MGLRHSRGEGLRRGVRHPGIREPDDFAVA